MLQWWLEPSEQRLEATPVAKSGGDGGGACVKPAGGGASGAAPMTRPCWARVLRMFRAMLA